MSSRRSLAGWWLALVHLVLTGPETLTQAEQARAIGDALGRPVRWEELDHVEDFR